jgi:hypothetical protein
MRDSMRWSLASMLTWNVTQQVRDTEADEMEHLRGLGYLE